MGRERQKKKNRSSIAKSRPKSSNSKRTKTGRRKVDFGNNEILSRNWDRKQTLSQNYARLGLSAKLVAPSGGVEKRSSRRGVPIRKDFADSDSLAIPRARDTGVLQHEEVTVERDEGGNIIRVVRSGEQAKNDNPLNDPLNDLEMETEQGPTEQKTQTEVVAALEKEAAEEAALLEKKRKPRSQSGREEEWIESLMAKYGDDVSKMVRDRKLNPMQQTEGDLKRRIKKWKAKRGEV